MYGLYAFMYACGMYVCDFLAPHCLYFEGWTVPFYLVYAFFSATLQSRRPHSHRLGSRWHSRLWGGC